MGSNFANASTFRPWPLSYSDKQGGSYLSYGDANEYGGGSSANQLIMSMRWTNTDYDFVLWGFMIQGLIVQEFSSNQIAEAAFYRATDFTVADSGGDDVSSAFGAPRNTAMPSVSDIGGFSMQIRKDYGEDDMTEGTRTLSNIIYADSIQTGTVSKSLTKAGMYIESFNAPIVIHANEGIVGYGVYALTGGTIRPQMIMNFDIVPTEVVSRFYA